MQGMVSHVNLYGRYRMTTIHLFLIVIMTVTERGPLGIAWAPIFPEMQKGATETTIPTGSGQRHDPCMHLVHAMAE